MRNFIHITLALVSSMAVGCASESTDDTGGAGAAGGKGDGASESGALVELGIEQNELRAGDAECFHINYTTSDLYPAAIKLICMPRGGVVSPIGLYIAAVSPGEGPGVYKVWELPGFFSDYPESVALRTVGEKAILSFTGKVADVNETDDSDFQYRTLNVTATLEFSGDPEDPRVVGKYTKQ